MIEHIPQLPLQGDLTLSKSEPAHSNQRHKRHRIHQSQNVASDDSMPNYQNQKRVAFTMPKAPALKPLSISFEESIEFQLTPRVMKSFDFNLEQFDFNIGERSFQFPRRSTKQLEGEYDIISKLGQLSMMNSK